MTQTNALMSRSAETKLTGRGSKATSLFGGAILATVATATLAQVTYVTSIGALGTITVASGYVVAGGYNTPGDGGGGTFMPGPSGCVSDNGLVFLDMAHNCFYRSDPTYSVREWGALCDVNGRCGIPARRARPWGRSRFRPHCWRRRPLRTNPSPFPRSAVPLCGVRPRQPFR